MASELNGSAPLGGHLDAASEECVKMLEKVLADAKAGKVQALVVVAVGQGGMGPGFVGADIPQLNLGVDLVKRQMQDMLFAQVQQAAQRRPNILRPGQR
jgi:hypothetical protein